MAVSPERWRRIESLYHAAVAQAPERRAAILDEACGDDDELRREVESLLAQQPSGFFEPQPPSAAAPWPPGHRLGAYVIAEPIGSGGMGEVFRAHDTRLRRDVAIKRISPAFAADRERVARFEREARLLASLNHPNIASIYGLELGQAGRAPDADSLFLVMELVEGATLADVIGNTDEGSGLPLGEALKIARQIADALEAAHEQGIVHRDLKPANVKVRDDGTVKVLDFGLAKALAPAGQESDAALAPTQTRNLTKAGLVFGTAGYMAPEQARGKSVGPRADIWAFGCMLFEMLSGRPAFRGEDVADTMVAVLSREPDWHAFPATASRVRPLVARCLEKDPKQRLQAIGDARIQIDELIKGTGTELPDSNTAVAPSRRRFATALGAFATGSAMTALALWLLPRPAPVAAPPVDRFTIALPPSQTIAFSFNDRDLVLSSDGRRLVFTGGPRSELLMRPLDQLDAAPVAGIVNARAPFLSPDGNWIGFFDRFDEGLTTGPAAQRSALRKVSTGGGPATVVAPVVGASRGAAWGADGRIVFATSDTSTGIMRVSADGSEVEVLTRPDRGAGEADHLYPSLLPEGRGVIFTVTTAAGEVSVPRVAILDYQTGQQRTVLREALQAQYAASGHLVYAASGTLWAVRFDLATLTTVGDPVPLIQQVLTLGAAAFNLSSEGSLAYIPDRRHWARSLVWVSRDGRLAATEAPRRLYLKVRLSPDGRRVAAHIREENNQIWIWDFARNGSLTRLTFDPFGSFSPIWSRDGRYVIYGSVREKDSLIGNLYRRAAGGGVEDRLTTSDRQQRVNTITADGTRLIIEEQTLQRDYDFKILSLANPQQVDGLLQTPFDERNAEISPDGRWMAYDSNESGQLQVYVRPFPDVTAAQYQVSTEGGRSPAWSPKGGELFFVSGTSMMRVGVGNESGSFRSGTPTRLFDAPNLALDGRFSVGGTVRTFDVAPDAQRFLAIKLNDPADEGGEPHASVVVVQNWLEELKQKVR